MSLPKSYMTSTKRLPQILEAIQTAQAPKTFSTRFVEQLGFKSKGDRLVIGVLKDLGFLDDKGVPQTRYYQFLDQSQSAQVLAEGIKESWADLFAINTKAYQLTKIEFKGKLKTLSEGRLSDRVVEQHYSTFSSLVKIADFTSHKSIASTGVKTKFEKEPLEKKTKTQVTATDDVMKLGGLVYNVQIVLPESRDTAVYDVLFRSLKEHLL